MIPRYSREAMASIWSEAKRFELWQEVEILVCEARAELGEVPGDDAREIRDRAAVEVRAVHEREEITNHDMAAFVDVLSDSIGPASRHLHFGLTSSDILDTALAVQLRDSGKLLLDGMMGFRQVLRQRAIEFKHTKMIGRTHGVHAEPMTFGLKLLHWYSEAGRVQKRLRSSVEDIAVGKLSGAVGTFAHLAPEIELYVCDRLQLRPESLATQVVPRDRHAAFVVSLAFLGSLLERIGTEIRHLQRTEVREVEEFFGSGQKGSSAMPHKRNPIRSERLVGLARLLRSHVVPALENTSLWHERDISHSSIERVILPDSCLAADYSLHLATRMIEQLQVDPQRMLENLELSRGLVYSQSLLLELIRSGMLRDEAYRLVQSASRQAWEQRRGLHEVALEARGILDALGRETIGRVFDLEHNLRHVDLLFERVFAEEKV